MHIEVDLAWAIDEQFWYSNIIPKQLQLCPAKALNNKAALS